MGENLYVSERTQDGYNRLRIYSFMALKNSVSQYTKSGQNKLRIGCFIVKKLFSSQTQTQASYSQPGANVIKLFCL
jgi:hypothetical protein